MRMAFECPFCVPLCLLIGCRTPRPLCHLCYANVYRICTPASIYTAYKLHTLYQSVTVLYTHFPD
uniref:Uncharacterized protein n=1 Tax=Anguilla anguilla TaxID=7936 RepID=A0A0E9S6H6_ANGAN